MTRSTRSSAADAARANTNVASSATLVIIDDHPLWADSISTLCRDSDMFASIHTARSLEEARAVLRKVTPDLLLVDINLPDGSGLKFCDEIFADFPEAKVVILTANDQEDLAMQALGRGAKGYLAKGVSGPELTAMLARVLDGGLALQGDLAVRVVTNQVAPKPTAASLSPRELEVLVLMCNGVTSTNDIAAALFISERTAKGHVSALFDKAGVFNRAELVAWAYRGGHVRVQPDGQACAA